MSKFVATPGEFDAPDAPMPPQTISDLLAVLGLSDAPADARGAGIRRWLRSNTPTPLLRADLVDHGFLPPEPRRTMRTSPQEAAAAARQRKAG